MKITKEDLKEIIIRKRRETKKKLLETDEKKSKRRFVKKGELKKIKLDYEVFLQ